VSDIEIPRQKNLVFLFTRSVGLVNFHTYLTVAELKEALCPNRPTMAYIEGADEGAGKVDQWFETVHDEKFEIVALAIKANVGGRVVQPGAQHGPLKLS
jgi:hypothetical protein